MRTLFKDDLSLTDEGVTVQYHVEKVIKELLDLYDDVNPRDIAHLFLIRANVESARKILKWRYPDGFASEANVKTLGD